MRGLDGPGSGIHAGAFLADDTEGLTLDEYRDRLCEVVKTVPGVLLHLPEPVKLASGDWSSDFVDGKRAVGKYKIRRMAGEAMLRAASSAGVEFDAVGGLLAGAAPFLFAVADLVEKDYFMVRKEPKGRGTNRWIEGIEIVAGTPVMIVDDVVTRGGSIVQACERVEIAGAIVVFATTLVDRADFARDYFKQRNIPYDPILTYRDLGIEPVGGSQQAQAV